MPAKFCLSEDMANFPKADVIAVGLALFHDTGAYPDFLGHYGRFERNPQAELSNLHKIHIAIYQTDFDLKTWQRRNGLNRTCDNFVIYTQHFFEEECFQILGIVTPDAHATIDKLLPYFIEQAERFHSMNGNQLSSLNWFDSSNLQIKNQVVLTE